MIKKSLLALIRSLRNEAGQTLVMAALVLVLLLGLVGFVVDTGHLYYSYQELMASTNAAAVAAANGLDTSYAQAEYLGAEFSAAPATITSQYGYTGAADNAYSNLNVTNLTITPGCIGSTVPMAANVPCENITTGSGASSTANAIQISQTIKVQTYFAPFLGTPYVNLTARSSALMRGTPAPYNIALILDTTGSMNDSDATCGMTQLACATQGMLDFLSDINPCSRVGDCQGTASNTSNYTNAFDRVALFAFPNGQTGAIPNDYGCNSLPQDELNPVQGLYLNNYKNAVPYVFPSIGGAVGTTSYVYTYYTYSYNQYGQRVKTAHTTTYAVTSEVTNGLGDKNGFMTNYQQTGSTNLNTSSDLVMALGGGGCSGIQAPYIDGTYYASVIYQAQSALTAEQKAYPGSQNVMVLLGDGDENVSYDYTDEPGAQYDFNSMVYLTSQTDGLVPTGTDDYGNQVGTAPSASYNYYPSWNNDCGQAILAAEYAKEEGTKIYVVAYGSPTGGAFTYQDGCSTDTTGIPLGVDGYTGNSTPLTGQTSLGISPCQSLKDIATSDATFFSDSNITGTDTGCHGTTNASYGSLAKIFQVIAGQLDHSRLIPNGVFTPSA